MKKVLKTIAEMAVFGAAGLLAAYMFVSAVCAGGM